MWARGFECARAVRSLVCVPCFVLERGVRIPALMSWVSVSCRGLDTRAPCSVSLCERAARVRSAACSLVHVCCVCVWCCTQFAFLSDACIHVMSCAVWHTAHVFHWLRAFMLSCLVWTRGLWVFSLAACSCPVLHMAGNLFCWPCACVFVLCEHMAFVFVLCVPCALMSIVLTPPILLPDYWLISPTCVYLVTLLICSLYNLLVFAVLGQFVINVTIACILSCPVCLVVPCPALPSLPAVLFFPYGVVLVCLFILLIKAHLLHHWVLAPSFTPKPWHNVYFCLNTTYKIATEINIGNCSLTKSWQMQWLFVD